MPLLHRRGTCRVSSLTVLRGHLAMSLAWSVDERLRPCRTGGARGRAQYSKACTITAIPRTPIYHWSYVHSKMHSQCSVPQWALLKYYIPWLLRSEYGSCNLMCMCMHMCTRGVDVYAYSFVRPHVYHGRRPCPPTRRAAHSPARRGQHDHARSEKRIMMGAM